MSSADEKGSEPIVWNTENEINLFHAMIGHKPAGTNKHFNMMCICEKLSSSIKKDVTSEHVWKHLETLYNLEMLDATEGSLFPNDVKDFVLPDSEYGPLMKLKIKEIVPKVEEPEDRSASPRVQNSSRSQLRASIVKDSVSKSVKKEPTEKSSKSQTPKDVLASNSTPSELTSSSKSSDKETHRSDLRRDSKDSVSSSKDSKTSNSNSVKTPNSKETKSSKPSRSSTAEKSEDLNKTLDDSSSKRGNKRSTRGSLKTEEPTPPSRRRRI